MEEKVKEMNPGLFIAVFVVTCAAVGSGVMPADAGHVRSEGAAVIGADLANQYGYTGKGVKVAVIDLGFDIYNSEISGNIAGYRSFDSRYGIAGDDTSHGTASAEVIVDVAPGVDLYLYNVSTEVEFLSLMDYIISRGDIDIISMSLGWVHGPFDGTSRMAQKVNEARDNGILFVTSAGNKAEQHWQGRFSDTDGDRFHNFSGVDETISIDVNAGDEVLVYLSWWDSPSQDFDLHLGVFDGFGNFEYVASSDRFQPLFDPLEVIGYTSPYTQTMHIVIESFANRNVDFQLFSVEHDLNEYRVPSSSITMPADAVWSMGVAASHWRTGVLEYYSSQGPTVDGRIKPDITGPTCVSNTAYDHSYCGTSAAAPHVAGAAALVIEKYPNYTAGQARAFLEENTANYHSKSNRDGTGLVDVSVLAVSDMPEPGNPDASLVNSLYTAILHLWDYATLLGGSLEYHFNFLYGELVHISAQVTDLRYDFNREMDITRANEDYLYDRLLEQSEKIYEMENAILTLSSSTRDPSTHVPSLSGTVYHDVNGNGLFDSGDTLIVGQTVLTINLSDFSDTSRTVSDAGGQYSFDLEPGHYLVQAEGYDVYAYVSVVSGVTTIQDLAFPAI